jgi:hypothetical protein
MKLPGRQRSCSYAIPAASLISLRVLTPKPERGRRCDVLITLLTKHQRAFALRCTLLLALRLHTAEGSGSDRPGRARRDGRSAHAVGTHRIS